MTGWAENRAVVVQSRRRGENHYQRRRHDPDIGKCVAGNRESPPSTGTLPRSGQRRQEPRPGAQSGPAAQTRHRRSGCPGQYPQVQEQKESPGTAEMFPHEELASPVEEPDSSISLLFVLSPLKVDDLRRVDVVRPCTGHADPVNHNPRSSPYMRSSRRAPISRKALPPHHHKRTADGITTDSLSYYYKSDLYLPKSLDFGKRARSRNLCKRHPGVGKVRGREAGRPVRIEDPAPRDIRQGGHP